MDREIREIFDDYTLQIWWSKEDDSYIAMMVELPCCKGDGATREEAIEEAYLSFEGWYDFYREDSSGTMILPQPMSRSVYDVA
ncbi:MAG: hypothetical protein IJV04_01075 [Lachnospiraceae bacterium]|nr:hypothetical protein [Lachnospiraceae bacterium]